MKLTVKRGSNVHNVPAVDGQIEAHRAQTFEGHGALPSAPRHIEHNRESRNLGRIASRNEMGSY